MGRLHREVMDQLTESIVSGRFAAGSLLMREVDLAEEFTVSRGVARETIRAMEERGLVSVRHGRGAVINPAAEWDLLAPEVLSAFLATEGSAEVLGQYIQSRRIIEVEAVALAAELAGPDDIARLEADLLLMEDVAAPSQVGDSVAEKRFHEADLAFHQSIFAAARNQVLASLVRRIHEALYIARIPLARPQFRIERAVPEHRAIFEAIRRRDPLAARAAMNAHLDTVAGYLGETRAVELPR